MHPMSPRVHARCCWRVCLKASTWNMTAAVYIMLTIDAEPCRNFTIQKTTQDPRRRYSWSSWTVWSAGLSDTPKSPFFDRSRNIYTETASVAMMRSLCKSLCANELYFSHVAPGPALERGPPNLPGGFKQSGSGEGCLTTVQSPGGIYARGDDGRAG